MLTETSNIQLIHTSAGCHSYWSSIILHKYLTCSLKHLNCALSEDVGDEKRVQYLMFVASYILVINVFNSGPTSCTLYSLFLSSLALHVSRAICSHHQKHNCLKLTVLKCKGVSNQYQLQWNSTPKPYTTYCCTRQLCF
jgi:hypothetical protein